MWCRAESSLSLLLFMCMSVYYSCCGGWVGARNNSCRYHTEHKKGLSQCAVRDAPQLIGAHQYKTTDWTKLQLGLSSI